MKVFTINKFRPKFQALIRILVLSFAFATQARAQNYQMGAHVGALGFGSESNIGFGAHVVAVPYGWAGLAIDGTFGIFSSELYFSSSPALILYPVDLDELKVGFMFGPGFYKYPNLSMHFGLNFGARGDFAVSESIYVGMQTRYFSVFGTVDSWEVMMTLGYKFEAGGGW